MVTYDPDDDFPFGNQSRSGSGPRSEGAGRAGGASPGGPGPDEEVDEEWERVRESGGSRSRKERVLHTRISEQLSDDIRRAAEDLRVPMSNLVRNVLEEAFGAVERVSDEVGGFLEEVLGETEGARSDLRRLRRRVTRLARQQRRRFARRPGTGGADPDFEAETEDETEDFAPRGEAPAGETAPRAPEPPHAPGAPPAPESPAPPRPEPSFPDVIGWQPLLANGAARCARCARDLEPGERVFAGATERGLSRTVLCGSCMRERSGA